MIDARTLDTNSVQIVVSTRAMEAAVGRCALRQQWAVSRGVGDDDQVPPLSSNGLPNELASRF
jgi:hypothetical protein